MGGLVRIVLIVMATSFHTSVSAELFDKAYWYKEGETELQASLKVQKNLNWNVAKNLILVIGDGMGVTTTTAARLHKGEKEENMVDAEALLSWDEFPHTGFSKTYNTDNIVTDSAASGTAYHCGVKAKQGTLGVDDSLPKRGLCDNMERAKVKSVLNWAQAEGKSIGIVTTDSLGGGSPSPLYAHSPDRDWKHKVPEAEAAKGCRDIVAQLIDDNADIQVLLGGGRSSFLGVNTPDLVNSSINGSRPDGRNLIEEWKNKKEGMNAQFVKNKSELDDVDLDNTDYLLGLFATGRMADELIRKVNQIEPSIADMVETAIKILKKNSKGFYLFVEGANIDVGHHENRARKAIEETLALDEAVRVIQKQTSTDDTLVVVSADHSHAFSFSGYSSRGAGVLGLSKINETLQLDLNNNSYTLLTYGNGPGAATVSIENLTNEQFEKDTLYPSLFPLAYENHAGEDVAIYASGPLSHLFSGTHEQTYIAHVFAYAACLNSKTAHCDGQTSSSSSSSSTISASLISMITLTVIHALCN